MSFTRLCGLAGLILSLVLARSEEVIDTFPAQASGWLATGIGWSVVANATGSSAYRGDAREDSLTQRTNSILGASWILETDVIFRELYAHHSAAVTRGHAPLALFPGPGTGVQLEADIERYSDGHVAISVGWYDASVPTWRIVLNASINAGAATSFHLTLIRPPGADRFTFVVTPANRPAYQADTTAIPHTLLDAMTVPVSAKAESSWAGAATESRR